MALPKLLIADSGAAFCRELSAQLEGVCCCKTAQSGIAASQLLWSFAPDTIVLDLMLPGLDGISLLRQAADRGLRPTVLAVSDYLSAYMLASLQELEVAYVIRKPCSIAAIAERTAELLQLQPCPLRTDPDPRAIVTELLRRLSVPTKLRGYTCLREALLLAMRQPGQAITKELYPAVAGLSDMTAMQVERSIRTAIDLAFQNRDEQLWRRYFQASAQGQLRKPSNGAFITRLADELLLLCPGENEV